ncbi:MAG: N-acetylmuramic acid 6-phosphate etherase [Acetobacteraceae bacterium]|nr:N-acetylmuramic acid 6-phosphate etherase [Acetobacteraceae bacterium]
MKPELPATETILARYADLDAWPPGDMLAAMWEAQLAAVAAVRPALPAIEAACVAASARLATTGRLVMVGAGTSGRIGAQDGAELPPTFNWPQTRLLLLMAGGDIAFTKSVENAEDDRDAAITAIVRHGIGPDDVVIGLAASGSTPFTTAAIIAARAAGALTIGMSNSAGGALLTAAEHPILVETGGEVIAGSTRMKAGTAQKVVLNLLSSTVMVLLGHVHRGLMVDMQAKNAKLKLRAIRMLRTLTGCDEAAAAVALSATDGRIKPAVLVVHGLDAGAADAALAKHSGRLRAALGEIGQ